MELSARVKALRAAHGFSQEELARKTQLSLRTIQRIEQNETEARGDTLQRLAEAFKLKPADLIHQKEKSEANLTPLLNISALCFIVYPVLGFIVPLTLRYFKRKDDQALDKVEEKLINFQITWTTAFTLYNMLITILKIMHLGGKYTFLSTVIIHYTFYALNFLVIILNAFRINSNTPVIYKPAISFLKTK